MIYSIQSVGLLKALYISPPDKPIHSDIKSTTLGSIQSCCILYEDYSFTFPPLSIARCSFTSIQLSELGRRGENENSTLGNSSKGDSNPGSIN